jgi:PAS domain-containing protein
MLMHAESIDEYAHLMRWIHVPISVMFVCVVFFVREYFRAGHLWLAWLVCGVRLLGLAVNFSTGVNLNFEEITALRQLPFLGEPVSIPIATRNPWGWIGPLSSLLYILFVLDASRTAWRTGTREARRRAATVGGSIVFFVVAATLHANLVFEGIVATPYLISAAFFGTVLVMAYELAMDVVRSAELSRELSRNERRMELAVEAADIGLWEWDVIGDRIQVIHGGGMFERDTTRPGNLESFFARIHADDQEAVRTAIRESSGPEQTVRSSSVSKPRTLACQGGSGAGAASSWDATPNRC